MRCYSNRLRTLYKYFVRPRATMMLPERFTMMLPERLSLDYLRNLNGDFCVPLTSAVVSEKNQQIANISTKNVSTNAKKSEKQTKKSVSTANMTKASTSNIASSPKVASTTTSVPISSDPLFNYDTMATGKSVNQLQIMYPLLQLDTSRANTFNTEQETPADNFVNFSENFNHCLSEMAQAGFFSDASNISVTKLYLHPPVYTCEQAAKFCGCHHQHAEMKNLFLKDKKKNLFLISALVGTEIKLKSLKLKGAVSGGLSFASNEMLYETMRLLPGSVTPFGLLYDKEACRITYYLDENALNSSSTEHLGFHPNACNATLVVHRKVFRKFIEEVTRHEVNVLKSDS